VFNYQLKEEVKSLIIMKRPRGRTLEKVTFWIVFILLLVIGIISAAFAMDSFENYLNPYPYSILLCLIGILIAYVLSLALKKYISGLIENIKDYKGVFFGLSLGFIGICLNLGIRTNNFLSVMKYSGEVTILDKSRRIGGSRDAGHSKIHFVLNGKKISYNCNYKYWETLYIGDRISIEYYKSKLGSDYIIYTDEINY